MEIYQDPLFVLFPICSLAVSLGAFLLLALPLSLLAWRDPMRLARYRINKDPIPVAETFWPSLGRLIIATFSALVLATLLWPIIRLTGVHAGPPPPWYEIAWQLPVFLIVDDICYYFVHRALHTRWFFKHVHAVHHRIQSPSAVGGGYFHPLEYVLITLVALTGPLLVGAHVMTIWIWAVFRQSVAADGHSGYDFPWSPMRWLPGYQGPAFHYFHHQTFRGNYANYFGYLDNWLGTESPGYREYRLGRSTQR